MEPVNSQWGDAWEHTEVAYKLLRSKVYEDDIGFLMLALGTGIQIHKDKGYKKRKAIEMGVANWQYPDERLAIFAERNNINFFSLTPQMSSYAELNQVDLQYHFGDDLETVGHWNFVGHEYAARFTAAHLCQWPEFDSI